jgi:hypothetical protein
MLFEASNGFERLSPSQRCGLQMYNSLWLGPVVAPAPHPSQKCVYCQSHLFPTGRTTMAFAFDHDYSA